MTSEQGGVVAQQITPQLELNEIQGDVLVGMQKHAELFSFFRISEPARFKSRAKEKSLRK